MKNIFPREYKDYLLLDRCGSGGMAEVFRAITKDPVSRLVVIKKSHSLIQQDPTIRNMFLDEIKVSARMNHPNIVHLHSYGQAAEYIELEYVHGKTISEIADALSVNDKNIPIPVALYLAHEVAKGLNYAHNMKDELNGECLNIIHRDISPQNIMLSYNAEVKILDFGIAKVANNLSHTEHGVLKGKPFYMSPEQANLSEAIDYRTDIFSLGVILWNMITHQKLFAATSSAEYLKNLEEFKIDDPRKYNPGCSENLSRVVLKSLQRHPKHRYSSINEFREVIYQESTRLCKGHSVVPFVTSWIQSEFFDQIEQDKEKLQNLLSQAKIYMKNLQREDTEVIKISSNTTSTPPSLEANNQQKNINSKKNLSKIASATTLALLTFVIFFWNFFDQWLPHADLTKIKNAKTLIDQKNWGEALDILKKVHPKERKKSWRNLLIQSQVGQIEWKIKNRINPDAIRTFDDEIYGFNQIKEDPSFKKVRSLFVKKAIESCLRSGSLHCRDHLFSSNNRSPILSQVLFEIADLLTYFYTPRFAVPVYAQAHRGQFDKKFCESNRQKYAIQNLIESFSQMSDSNILDFQTVALGECFPAFKPEIKRVLAGIPNSSSSKLCQVLKKSRSPAQAENLCNTQLGE